MLQAIPNILSFLRLPLAFIFLSTLPWLRGSALLVAMLTDYLDGFLARKYKITSRLGTVLDPSTDKFFVIFVLSIFFQEGRIDLWQIIAMLSRDIALLIFSCYLTLQGTLQDYQYRAIWSGKIATTLQFFALLALTFNIHLSPILFFCFILLGIGALVELLYRK